MINYNNFRSHFRKQFMNSRFQFTKYQIIEKALELIG